MRNQLMIAAILTALTSVGLPQVLLAADSPNKMSAEELKKSPVSATLDLDVKQIGLILGGQRGEGVLHYQGKDYPFQLRGLQVGVIAGATRSNATGEVRMLNNLDDFAGNYSAVVAGVAVGKGGDTSSFQNNKGVVFTLKQKTTGLGFDLGLTSAEITFKK